MCGICGFNFEDRKLLKRMTDEIRHRGPNASGYFTDKGVSLGSRRLSIIDLSKAGNQPIFNEDKSIALVYNGEIFNFKEIRQELIEKGHSFTSNTDSEVVVHAYEEYGVDCLNYFNGFWGFALYDSKKKLLFLSRDRLGLKPLYYYYNGNKLVFASEIKAILKDPAIKRKINLDALSYFITYRYIPSDLTIFTGIKKLKPCHYALLNLKTGNLNINEYWDIPLKTINRSKGTIEKELINLLKDSVRRRLISDVPLGVYLSGGIDSSSIVAMMKDFSDDISTYSLAFEHDNIGNELRYAKNVSSHFGTRHKEITISTDIIKDLPKIVWHLDEPMSDPAAVPVYYLSKEAKKSVTVILTGDGADELFAGYDQYKFLSLGYKARHIPKPIIKAVPGTIRLLPKAVLDKIYKYSSATGSKMFDRIAKLMSDIKNNKAKAYVDVVGVFDDEEKQSLLNFDFKLDYDAINREFFSRGDFTTQLMYFDAKTYLPEDLLMKPDKMCMANSIEARVPYLDYRLVEYAFSIPSSLKLRNNTTKYILKKALRNYLPKDIIYRKKQPFQMPLDQWLSKELKDYFFELMQEPINSKLFNKSYIKKIFDNYNSSKLYYGRQLWSLGIFNIWHKVFVEEDKEFLKF
ncbi:MAG: asparagine synthase (glutamine-hydrolyzing) [Nanoarchaeota archaeon]|nr:asparagine synthase (glutamine-hydrolyzing) [Nanoarchaeota archaeon]